MYTRFFILIHYNLTCNDLLSYVSIIFIMWSPEHFYINPPFLLFKSNFLNYKIWVFIVLCHIAHHIPIHQKWITLTMKFNEQHLHLRK